MNAPPRNGRTAVNIDEDVEMICEQIEGLKRLGRQELVSEGERYNFSIQWGAVMSGRLPRLTHYCAQRLLTDTDTGRFRSLCDELRAVSPTAGRLGLPCPTVSAGPDTAG